MSSLSLQNVHKRFGSVIAVDDFNLTVENEEVVVFVGPSGCGKTTTLRIVAGLEAPTSGDIVIGGRCVTKIPPAHRDIAMVFQNFALYPHMTVRQNIGLSLQVRGVKGREINSRVAEIAAMLAIEDLLERHPWELSGGQKQRVAVGRAIIREPSVLLMDEPLSNLDAQLRVTMRSELKKLVHRVRTTTIYVTHDQVEAMTMGDRIVVMSEGKIQQVDSPGVVYERPANLFVARTIGSPPMNTFSATISSVNGQVVLRAGELLLPVPPQMASSLAAVKGNLATVVAGIRPEALIVEPFSAEEATVAKCVVEVLELHGSSTLVHLDWNTSRLIAQVLATNPVKEGERVAVRFNSEKLRVFDPVSGLLVA